MGLKGLIYWAIVGPLLLSLLLLSHTGYRVYVQKPGPITITDFPREIAKADKESIIKSRKGLLEDVMDAFAGKFTGGQARKFVKERFTSDGEFEDPWSKFKGSDELYTLVETMHLCMHNIEYDIHGEFHGPHEYIVDWTMVGYTKLFPNFALSIPMRSHFLVEPAAKPGTPEKIFRIYEEWNGNALLNEKTTVSYIGQIQSRFRRFIGMATVSFMQTVFL